MSNKTWEEEIWRRSLGKTTEEIAMALYIMDYNPPSYPFAFGVAQAVIYDLLRELTKERSKHSD